MKTQAQNDKGFLRNYLVKNRLVESGNDDIIAIKVRNSGEPFFIEIYLERSNLTLRKLSQIILKEFEMSEDISFLITKQLDVLIRDDKDIKRLKTGDKTQLIQVNAS